MWPFSLFKKKPRVHRVPLNGIDAFVFSVRDEGQNITVTGWTNHYDWNKGDIVQLVKADNSGGTYRIEKIEHCHDPHDMYFMDCHYVGPNWDKKRK